MTNPVFFATNAEIDPEATDSATHDPALASHATGDLLIVGCSVARCVTSETLVVSGGSGSWTVIYNSQNYEAGGTNKGVMAMAARIAESASESDPTYTLGTAEDEWNTAAFTITGATDTIGDITKSVDVSQAGDTGDDYTCPALTLAGGDNAVIYFVGISDNNHLSPVSGSTPPNSISYQSGLSGEGNQCAQAVATGFASSSLSSGTWTAVTDGGLATIDSIGIIALGIPESAAVPVYEQVSFRFRNDDGSLTELA